MIICFDDYHAVRIPTSPSTYGFDFTRKAIAASRVLEEISIGLAAVLIRVD